MDFFYPNYNNDMWRIFGLVFFNDRDYFADTKSKVFKKEKIVSFLKERGVALYDTACAVIRTKNTASDKDLEIVRQTDLDALLRQIPRCEDVIVTGQKAADVFATHFGIEPPRVGFCVPFSFQGRTISLWRMPSSSRAYPMNIERKAAFYKAALCKLESLREK